MAMVSPNGGELVLAVIRLTWNPWLLFSVPHGISSFLALSFLDSVGSESILMAISISLFHCVSIDGAKSHSWMIVVLFLPCVLGLLTTSGKLLQLAGVVWLPSELDEPFKFLTFNTFSSTFLKSLHIPPPYFLIENHIFCSTKKIEA